MEIPFRNILTLIHTKILMHQLSTYDHCRRDKKDEPDRQADHHHVKPDNLVAVSVPQTNSRTLDVYEEIPAERTGY